jgi:hypothetical protein
LILHFIHSFSNVMGFIIYIILLFFFFVSILIFFKYCSNIFLWCFCILQLFNQSFFTLHINLVITFFMSFPLFFLLCLFCCRVHLLSILLKVIIELLYLSCNILSSFHWSLLIILVSKLILSVSLNQPELWLRKDEFVFPSMHAHVTLSS